MIALAVYWLGRGLFSGGRRILAAQKAITPMAAATVMAIISQRYFQRIAQVVNKALPREFVPGSILLPLEILDY